MLGLFLLASNHPVAAKPAEHPQGVQSIVLVELDVNLALQGLVEQVKQVSSCANGMLALVKSLVQRLNGRLVPGRQGLLGSHLLGCC